MTDFGLRMKLFGLETWKQTASRVSNVVMCGWKAKEEARRYLSNKMFLPNSICLVNAGKGGGLAACHIMHVPRDFDSVFELAAKCLRIGRTGAGVGLDFSALSAGQVIPALSILARVADVLTGCWRPLAMMGTLNASHPDILPFIRAKEEDGQLSCFNLSVTLSKGPHRVDRAVWKEIVARAHANGEPGVVFLDNINRSNPTLRRLGPIRAVSACVTGDTLVAVADGRDMVPIERLAQEGTDVPVYSQGLDGIVIRVGRNPRRTGNDVPVVRVTLDDGSSIRTTRDHRFMLRSGEYIKAVDLQAGDSPMPFKRVVEEAHGLHNHTVVSVESDGVADVYNITVDEYHNLAYITNPNDRTPSGRVRISGVVTRNCGEVPHYNFGSCVLGSIVLPNVIDKLGEWERLDDVTRFAVRFLDRVIDVSPWPLPELGKQARLTRDLGIGVVGWESLLGREGIDITSREATELARAISLRIGMTASSESWLLTGDWERRRNRIVTAIAPTGHVSRLAGVSRSIYPSYGTMLQMKAMDHIDLVSAWQTSVENGVSYTACFSNERPPLFVDAIFRGAWARGLKAISVYRDGSREGQPLKCPECEEGVCER